MIDFKVYYYWSFMMSSVNWVQKNFLSYIYLTYAIESIMNAFTRCSIYLVAEMYVKLMNVRAIYRGIVMKDPAVN